MEKECKSCRKRGCPEKKIIKLERRLKSWFRTEKLSLTEGALLADECLDKLVSKLSHESKKDRLALAILKMKRAARDERVDDLDDDDGDDYGELPKNKGKLKKKVDLWYIG